jgi:hypothetical protein
MGRAGRIPAGLFCRVAPPALGTIAALGQALLFAIVRVHASTAVGLAGRKAKLNPVAL